MMSHPGPSLPEDHIGSHNSQSRNNGRLDAFAFGGKAEVVRAAPWQSTKLLRFSRIEPCRIVSWHIVTNPFFTIGHSTRSIQDFVELLQAADVSLLIDVRTVPRSRINPQFNRETLPATLSHFQIDYEHIAALGGLRGHERQIAPAVNGFWQNQSFHNYADYAMGECFHEGLKRLRELGHVKVSAIMCAEAVWWRCHRRIIADYLIAADEIVFHILGVNRIERARMSEGAKTTSDAAVTYPSLI